MMTPDSARELARQAVEWTHADQAEALVIAEDSALTRFANNRVNQNVAESNALVSVRAVLGKRVGVASTNRLDEVSLRATCDAAVRAARVAPEDRWFPGLPEPESIRTREEPPADLLDAEGRALAVRELVGAGAASGLSSAGKVRTSRNTLAVANSLGVDVGASSSAVQATVLAARGTGSGWASHLSRSGEGFDPAALGAQAADLAVRSANPTDLDPGVYPVVLGSEAVADVMDFLAYVGFSAKAYEEGRSFLSNRLESQIMSEYVTIIDDALAPHALGFTFDYEGMPKTQTPLIEYGVGVKPVTDSYWAAKGGWPNTGHALPAPNTYGPMPLNLEMTAGEQTLDELIGSVERGVYVTRFHYVNVEDPVPVTLTGMTRDGTFLIENGKLTRPLKNVRFTQSMVDAFYWCEGVTAERRLVGTEDGASYVPSVLLQKFAFTGQTS